MSDVADDEGGEDEEQGDHRERSGSPDHFWKIVREDMRRMNKIKKQDLSDMCIVKE